MSWWPFEVSSPSTKKVSGKRNSRHPSIPSPVGAVVRGLEWVETCRRLDAAQDGSQMVSERFSPVVALEIAGHRRAPADPPGNARSDPTTQSRKSAVECREDSWAFAASRFRSSLPGYDSQVHGQAGRRNGEVSELADLPAQSYGRQLGNGLFHRAHHSIPNPLCGSWSSIMSVVRWYT